MTHTDFNQLLSRIDALTAQQALRLRRQLDERLAQPKKPTAQSSGKGVRRTRPAAPKKKMTEEEFDQHLLKIGLMSQLPDTASDFDDPDDVPVDIKGEPLSETVIRERR
jgi:hypothetical protein